MNAIALAVAVAEVVLDEPCNTTLHTCQHAHVLKMPTAVAQYKLLTFGPSYRIRSFKLLAMLRYSVLLRETHSCGCLREWAYKARTRGIR